MSRLARAVQILQAINEHFQADAVELYADAQILDSDQSIKDAIAECIRVEDETPIAPVPHSKRKKISKNKLGNWGGFLGKRKVMDFGTSEEAANQWLWGI